MYLDTIRASAAPERAVENEPHRTLLQEGIHDVTGLVWGNTQSNFRDNVEHFTATVAKVAPLMMIASGRSYAATAILYGLDQAKTGDSLGLQMADFAAGAAKGAGTKYVFQEVGGSKSLGWAEKGVLMGGLSTALDVGLTRQTYVGANGQTDVLGGVGRVAEATLNPTSLATSALLFGAAHYGLQGLKGFAPAIEQSTVAQNMAVGGIFGTTSGALGELQRQRNAHENLDLGKIVSSSLFEGTAMSVASIPGGIQMARAGVPTSAIAPERPPLAETLRGMSSSLASRVDDFTSSMRGKFNNMSSMIKGNDLGMAMASGDITGSNGEATRSVAPDSGNQPAYDGTGRFRAAAPAERTRTPGSILRDEGLPEYAESLAASRKLNSLKAIKWIGSGNETQAALLLAPQAGLPDGGVLKIGHYEGGFDASWGSARRPFDAKILIKPVDLDLHGADTTAYVQETLKVQDSYPVEDVNVFLEKVRLAGLEWADPGTNPAKQIGYNSAGELALLDYAAVGRPGENATLDELINGEENRRHAEDDLPGRQAQIEQEEREEHQAIADYGNLDTSLEARRQDAVRDQNRTPAERTILEQLFFGESVDDVALFRAVEMSQTDPSKFEQFTKLAKQEVLAVRKKAIAEGLIEGKRSKPSDDDY